MSIFNAVKDIDGETEREIKEFLKVQYFGDILVDVKIQFNPSMVISDDDSRNKMALDMVNSRLQMLSGQISHDIRDFLKEQINPREEDQL